MTCSKQGTPLSSSSPLNNPNSATYGSGVWANNYSSTQNDIPKPTIDLAYYSNAQPGPAPHPDVFDPGATLPSLPMTALVAFA